MAKKRTPKNITRPREIPWRSVQEHELWRQAVAELCIMALILERDWTQDDTTNEQDRKLLLASQCIRMGAYHLRQAFDQRFTHEWIESKKEKARLRLVKG